MPGTLVLWAEAGSSLVGSKGGKLHLVLRRFARENQCSAGSGCSRLPGSPGRPPRVSRDGTLPTRVSEDRTAAPIRQTEVCLQAVMPSEHLGRRPVTPGQAPVGCPVLSSPDGGAPLRAWRGGWPRVG